MNRSPSKPLLGRPAKPGRRLLNNFLHRVECGLPGGSLGPLRHPPVFIIGVPRCGSTFLYQIMLKHFDLGYLSNFHCLFYGAPSLAHHFARPEKWKKTSRFDSKYGVVTGWNAPSECGEFWYRFFRRRPQYVSLCDVDEASLGNLRSSMRAIGNAMGRPILFKNLLCAVRLEPIVKAIPESLFIVLWRDWLDTAHSILAARHRLFGNYDDWFSTEPQDVGEISRLPVHEQAVEQIRSIHRLIDTTKDHVGSKKFIDIDYEDLCEDTYATLDRLAAFLEAAGVPVSRGGEVPRSFEIKREVRIDRGIYEKTKEYLSANPR